MLKRLREAFGFIEYKIDEHYKPLPELQDKYFLPVEILKGRYKGVTFSFENVQWHRLVVPGGERMVATYDIQPITTSAPESVKLSDKVLTKEFKATADDIWVDYAAFMMDNHNKLKEQVLQDNTEAYPDEEYRNDDLEKFDGARSLRSKSHGVPAARVRSKQKRTTLTGRDQGLHSKVQPTSVKDGD